MQNFSPHRRWLIVALIGMIALSSGCTRSNAPPIGPTEAPQATFIPTAQLSSLPPVTLLPAPTGTSIPTTIALPLPTTTLLPTPSVIPTPIVQPIDPALARQLQNILDQLVADGSIPGVVLAVHIPGQQPWVGASGYRDRETQSAMEPTTQVRIASISKIFTAVVVLQLVEEGRLTLATPVSTWFPGLVPHGDQTTVQRLLNHTTGLYDYLEDKAYLNRAFQQPDYHWPPEQLVAYAATHASAFLPGAPNAWDYSSTNYVILGMIVERVTGHTLAAEIRQRILEPLNLKQTFFSPDEQVAGIQAHGYRWTIDQTNISLSFAFATASIVSTVSDVQRFGDALFGGQLLKPETLQLMLTFQNGKGQYAMPALEYGMGVMRNRLPVSNDARGHVRPADVSRVMGHTGGFGGFRTVLWHAPESGITIALAMNQGATDPNILATRTFNAILTSQGR